MDTTYQSTPAKLVVGKTVTLKHIQMTALTELVHDWCLEHYNCDAYLVIMHQEKGYCVATITYSLK